MELLTALDLRLFYILNHLPHFPLTDGFAFFIHRITYGGIIYYPFLIFFVLRKDSRERLLAKLGLLAGLAAYILTDIIGKNIFERLRPCATLLDAICVAPSPLSYSFPSGQAATAFAVAAIVAFIYPVGRKTKWALFGWAAIVALDRVYMGHHYPSDVLAGAAIGALAAYAVFWARQLRA